MPEDGDGAGWRHHLLTGTVSSTVMTVLRSSAPLVRANGTPKASVTANPVPLSPPPMESAAGSSMGAS